MGSRLLRWWMACWIWAGLTATHVLAQHEGHEMPGMASKGAVPWTQIGIALGVIVVLLLFRLLLPGRARRVLNRPTIIGLVLIIATYLVVAYFVRTRRPPGAMTVVEAQAMDMTVMRPPEGATPVATVTVEPGSFEAAVTYTGTVVAYNDEDVYPRVVGRIIAMPVYPGDKVKPGQLVARLDSVELSANERAAAHARLAAAHGEREAAAEVSEARAMQSGAESEVRKAGAMVTEAQRELERAGAAVRAMQSEVSVARQAQVSAQKELVAAQEEKAAAEAEHKAAGSMQTEAEADLQRAEADMTYWRAAIVREKKLLDERVISLDEYQDQKAKHDSAAAMVASASAKVSQTKSGVEAAAAQVRRAEAGIGAAQAEVQKMGAEVEKAGAEVTESEAMVRVAEAKVAQAEAERERAGAEREQAGSAVRAAQAGSARMGAMTDEAASTFVAASTVRGYTEIRATVNGEVTARLVSPGVLVSPGTPILRIAQIDRVRLQANVAEKDVARIALGNAVRVKCLTSREHWHTAKVTSIFPAADPATRTSTVEAIVANAERHFLPGQYVVMRIVTGRAESALAVPIRAIVHRPFEDPGVFFTEQRPALWVVTTRAAEGPTMYTCPMHPDVRSETPGDCPKCGMKLEPEHKGGADTAHLVFVTLGPTDGERTVVQSGLKEDQEVIVEGHQGLREGHAVVRTPWATEGPVSVPPPPGAPGVRPTL